MSRTHGINSVERHEHDEYITGAWCIQRLFEKYQLPEKVLYVLDPCASRGELLSIVEKLVSGISLFGYEINEACAEGLKSVVGPSGMWIGDFLAVPAPDKRDPRLAIVSNPPYRFAQAFIEQSLRFAPVVVMLLRLNFLAARERREFTARTNPGVFVLPNRPSFDGWGSDGCEYAWMVYGDPRVAGTWQVLDLTPDDVIEAHNAAMRKRYPEVGERKRQKRLDKAFEKRIAPQPFAASNSLVIP
jgi:hypothetical protein